MDANASPAPTAFGDKAGGTRRVAGVGGGTARGGGGLGLGGARSGRGEDGSKTAREVRPSEMWTSNQEPDDYEFVRLLHRSRDHGISAVSETVEQRHGRQKLCKTTGWQSKFAVPYRPLGIPQLQVDRAKELQSKDATGDGGQQKQKSAAPISARAQRIAQNGVTPSGRPMDWLPKARAAMENFSVAARQNQQTHRQSLLQQVSASDRRVKFVRAGVLATDVLQANAQGRQKGAASPSNVFLTSVGETELDDIHPLERKRLLKARQRPAQVPSLKIGEGSVWAGGGGAQTERPDLASTLRNTLRTPGTGGGVQGPPGTARAVLQSAGGGSSAFGGAASFGGTKTPASEQAVMSGIGEAGGGGGGGHAQAQLTARQKAVAGDFQMQLPVPPLKLLAESFVREVDELTDRVKEELSGKSTERLDTFRRKFKNFELGDMGSTATSQLSLMRAKADKEKLQNEIYLYQNRKWYMQLMGKVADQASDEQLDLLRTIREMVEGGVVFNKSTVRELVGLWHERGQAENFVSRPIQDVFDFLCAQFGVLGEEYDGWLEDTGLPLPPSTLARYEAARQKRLDLFKREIVAKHWRQRFDMMATTKALDEWLPHDVLHTVMSAMRESHRRSPDSVSNYSRASSRASERSGAASAGPGEEGGGVEEPAQVKAGMGDAQPHAGFGGADDEAGEGEAVAVSEGK